MTPQGKLSDTDFRLLAGAKGYFFQACIDSFPFLLEFGFRSILEDVGRDCYRVTFKQDRPSGYFTIRVYQDCDDMLWCDLEGYSGHEVRIRLNNACQSLKVACPSTRLPHGPLQVAVEQTVGAIAAVISTHLSELCEIVCKEPVVT